VGKLKAIIEAAKRAGIDKPQPPRQMPDEAARQAIRPTEKTIDDFSNEDSFYRIVDEDAYIDLVNSGAVRTNFGNKPGSTITDKLASRPTRYPSFSKGSANKTYAEGKPNHYIIETKDPSIKPSTEGRHGKGTTQFPTDSTGVHLESLPGEAVQVYRHIGDGQYRLVYDQGKVTPNATNAETNVAAPLGNISIPIAAAIAAGTMTPQEAQAGPISAGRNVAAELAKRAAAGAVDKQSVVDGYAKSNPKAMSKILKKVGKNNLERQYAMVKQKIDASDQHFVDAAIKKVPAFFDRAGSENALFGSGFEKLADNVSYVEDQSSLSSYYKNPKTGQTARISDHAPVHSRSANNDILIHPGSHGSADEINSLLKSLSDKTDEIQQGIGSLPAGDEMVTGGDLQFLMNKLVREQSVKQAKEQGLASNPFATGITGLGAMAALPPEEAQAGPLSAAGRAAQKGFTKDVYHGTTQDFDQVDPDAVDLGIHVGTPAQAANRLRDTTGNRFSGSYDEGANIMPLKARMNNTLEMEDAGDWKDSYQVLGSLRNTPVGRKNRAKIQEMEEQADEIMGQYAYGDEEWRDSPENRELLDEINTMLADSGYDSIRYKNQVENTYGSSAGLTPQAEQRKAAISKEINALDRKLYARKPDMPAMDDPDLAAKMDAFLSFDANKERTPADAARRQQLLDENMAISEDPANQADTNSYIILDPDANLRSRNAQFMDERGNLLASVGTGLGVAVAAGSAPEAQAGSIMTGVNLAKEVALKNLATRVNKGELSASEARALSSFVNNSVSPDTLIQGGYLNPNNMDPGQIKAATTRYIKALEDNPMLRRREGIGGARDPSSTEFYPAEMNDPRIILPEDLLGEILMPNVGDTTQIGVLTKFGGYDLPEGVPSHGGPGFPQQMEELGRPYGWASNQGAANAKVAGFNKVATDTNQQPIAVVTSMGEEAQLFASPYAHAWILKAQELNMPKKQAAKFDAEVRRGVPNKDPKKKAIISPFPEWVGINHPDAKAQLLGGPSPTREGVTYPSVGGRRKSVLLTANKNVEWRNSGLPSLGDLHKGLQINPNETAFEVGRSGYSMYTPEIGVPTEPIDFHQAYDTAIRGKYKGQIEGVTVPGRVMFPDIVKAYTDRGKTEAMAIGGFMANPNIYQKADQRWLDGIRDYLDNLPPVDRDNIIKALPALGVTSAGLAALGIALAPQKAQAGPLSAAGRAAQMGLPVRPAREDLNTVLQANMIGGRVVGDETVPIDSLMGGAASSKRGQDAVNRITEQMSGPDGYIERLIVDQDGNVIEGAHRLDALRRLGIRDVPITRISDPTAGIDVAAMSQAINDVGVTHPDHVNQIVASVGEMLAEVGGDPAKVLDQYVFPRGYEDKFRAALGALGVAGAAGSAQASEYPSLGGMGVTSRAMPDEVAFKAPMPDEVAFKAPREPRRIPPKQPPGIASLAGQLGLGAMSEIAGAIFGGLAGAAEYGRGSGPSMGGMAGAPATAESIRNINEGVSGYVGDLYDAGPEAQALGQQIMQGIGETIAPIAEYAMEGDITDEYGINMLPLLAQKLGIPLYELLERVYSMMPELEQEALKSGADAFL
jgi:hypothetical protein